MHFVILYFGWNGDGSYLSSAMLPVHFNWLYQHFVLLQVYIY